MTPLALGPEAGFELVADTRPPRRRAARCTAVTAIASVVVVLMLCTSVGDAAGDAIAPTCDDGRPHRPAPGTAPAATAAGAPAPAAERRPYSFRRRPGSGRRPRRDPRAAGWRAGVARRPLVGEPGDGVLVRLGPPGGPDRRTRLLSGGREDPPHSTQQAGTGRTIDGRPAVRCDATSFTDPAGHPIPDLHSRRLRPRARHRSFRSSSATRRTPSDPEATKGCDAVLGTLKFRGAGRARAPEPRKFGCLASDLSRWHGLVRGFAQIGAVRARFVDRCSVPERARTVLDRSR